MSLDDKYLPSSGNGGYRVRHYDITLTYRPDEAHLSGWVTVHLTPERDLTRFSLDLAGLEVSRVRLDGHKVARTEQRGSKLVIWPDAPIAGGREVVVDITYAGTPTPIAGPWGEAGWDTLSDGVIVASQPDGAASWFPCNDHPSNKSTFNLSITTDSRYTVVASGNLTARVDHKDRSTWSFAQPEPIATYQASVQIGVYERIDLGKRSVRLSIFAPARRASRAREDFARLRQMFKQFERSFGPYPYSSYSVVVTAEALDVPHSTQGMGIFGANHVDGKQKRERLIAHQLAHQWFGGSVTVRNWRDVWLNEGFATYAEWLWSEASGGTAIDSLAAKHWTRLSQLPADLVVADPQPEFLFDDRVYKRGALALYLLHAQLGDVQFTDLVTTWTSRHRHGTVTTEDFLTLVKKRAGKDAAHSVAQWVNRRRLPELELV